MNQHDDLASAVMQRERSRRRMRRVTVTVGAASLATAGVVAYYLPGAAHTTTVSRAASTPTAQPSTAIQNSGDDDEGGAITAPGSTASQAPAHSTSGGS
jgi:hypothetical protein